MASSLWGFAGFPDLTQSGDQLLSIWIKSRPDFLFPLGLGVVGHWVIGVKSKHL